MKKPSAYIYPLTTGQRAKSSVKGHGGGISSIRYLLVFHYLLSCLRHRVVPYGFFQLNGGYFNPVKGIFSKLEVDNLIPDRWRLAQYPLDPESPPWHYPVFLKPEWGQNSNGIWRIDDEAGFHQFLRTGKHRRVPYMVQEAAEGTREFELYYLRSPEKNEKHAFFSITEVLNRNGEQWPINSIHNHATRYHEITGRLNAEQRERIWQHVRTIGRFRMARIGVKADSRAALVEGRFKIVEINLFLPMPLVLLTENVAPGDKRKISRKTMDVAARLVAALPSGEKRHWIFFRKMLAHYKVMR